MTRRKPVNRTQRHLDRPPRERYSTRTLSFESGGSTCRGTLYRPSRADDPPVVVMAPGLGAERTFGLPAVAERFAAAGYAAFLFDYRGFGDSDGRTQLVSPARHREDYGAAIERVRRLESVGDRLVLWGISLSGAHVLTIAADRRDVDAVAAVVPVTDARAILRQRDWRYTVGATRVGLRDLLGHRLGLGRDVPIVGDAAEYAAIPETGAKRSYLDLVDRDSQWENRTPARSLLRIANYRPVERLADISAPTLLLAGNDDTIVPLDTVEHAADELVNPTFVRMPADHWSVLGGDFEPAIGHQLSFLADALPETP